MKILAMNGSPRRNGNTTLMLRELLRGANEAAAETEEIVAQDLNLKNCRGCLRCNLVRRCAVAGDDWKSLSRKILDSDAVIFASPVYFHHLTAPMKKIIDRFRSFVHVQIKEDGLVHTPWQVWQKKFILLLCMGSADSSDARHIIELFSFITKILGPGNSLKTVAATRLAVAGQVTMPEKKISELYRKLKLPEHLAADDFKRNREVLNECYEIGKKLAS